MRTNWDAVEQLVVDLEKENKLREGKLVESLWNEATELEDDIYCLNEKVKEYDDLFDEILELVTERQKVLNAVPGSATKFEKELIAKMWKLHDMRGRYQKK